MLSNQVRVEGGPLTIYIYMYIIGVINMQLGRFIWLWSYYRPDVTWMHIQVEPPYAVDHWGCHFGSNSLSFYGYPLILNQPGFILIRCWHFITGCVFNGSPLFQYWHLDSHWNSHFLFRVSIALLGEIKISICDVPMLDDSIWNLICRCSLK